MRVAAVDIGTNSVRMLLRDGDAELARTAVITRLGQGVHTAGRLADGAVARTLDELTRLRAILDEHDVHRVRAVATSAVRDAADGDAFLDRAAAILGTRPVLLSGEEEGRLTFVGATAPLDPARGPFLVVDIGGGSTEFIVGTDRLDGVRSVDIGCVRLTEAHLHHDPPLPEELANAIGLAADHLEDVRRELPLVDEARTLVGVAGTITTVAAVELGLAVYDRARVHHLELDRAAVEDVFRTLATEPLADRVHNPGLQPERADVIVGGLCILVAIMRGLEAPSLLVSETDLLDGIVAQA